MSSPRRCFVCLAHHLSRIPAFVNAVRYTIRQDRAFFEDYAVAPPFLFQRKQLFSELKCSDAEFRPVDLSSHGPTSARSKRNGSVNILCSATCTSLPSTPAFKVNHGLRSLRFCVFISNPKRDPTRIAKYAELPTSIKLRQLQKHMKCRTKNNCLKQCAITNTCMFPGI